MICYNSSVQLHGSMDGIVASWSPAGSLNDPHILNPVASPTQTTFYVLSVTDTKGCPKPGRDTVIVTVLPKIIPFAGRDTAVVIGQPLQLNASGGFAYQWIPSDYLSSPVIANPVAQFDAPIDGIRYKVLVFDEANCVDSAFITVKVFKSLPTIFVPSAFTPNNDGLNDVLRPLAVGIQQIDYFRIYNRWGQLMFSTQTNGDGWDGKLNGDLQGSGSYVWIVKATDYLGKVYLQKGTFTLVR
jgi:gliding motility-associated-like protein